MTPPPETRLCPTSSLCWPPSKTTGTRRRTPRHHTASLPSRAAHQDNRLSRIFRAIRSPVIRRAVLLVLVRTTLTTSTAHRHSRPLPCGVLLRSGNGRSLGEFRPHDRPRPGRVRDHLSAEQV